MCFAKSWRQPISSHRRHQHHSRKINQNRACLLDTCAGFTYRVGRSPDESGTMPRPFRSPLVVRPRTPRHEKGTTCLRNDALHTVFGNHTLEIPVHTEKCVAEVRINEFETLSVMVFGRLRWRHFNGNVVFQNSVLGSRATMYFDNVTGHSGQNIAPNHAFGTFNGFAKTIMLYAQA